MQIQAAVIKTLSVMFCDTIALNSTYAFGHIISNFFLEKVIEEKSARILQLHEKIYNVEII